MCHVVILSATYKGYVEENIYKSLWCIRLCYIFTYRWTYDLNVRERANLYKNLSVFDEMLPISSSFWAIGHVHPNQSNYSMRLKLSVRIWFNVNLAYKILYIIFSFAVQKYCWNCSFKASRFHQHFSVVSVESRCCLDLFRKGK